MLRNSALNLHSDLWSLVNTMGEIRRCNGLVLGQSLLVLAQCQE